MKKCSPGLQPMRENLNQRKVFRDNSEEKKLREFRYVFFKLKIHVLLTT